MPHETEPFVRVTSEDDGSHTIAISGTLDADAVAAVLAVARRARGTERRIILDLTGVSDVDGDSLGQLARSLRDLGVALDVEPTDPR